MEGGGGEFLSLRRGVKMGVPQAPGAVPCQPGKMPTAALSLWPHCREAAAAACPCRGLAVCFPCRAAGLLVFVGPAPPHLLGLARVLCSPGGCQASDPGKDQSHMGVGAGAVETQVETLVLPSLHS